MSRTLAALTGAALIISSGCATAPAAISQTAGMLAATAGVPGLAVPVTLLTGLLLQHHIDKTTETRERRELSDQMAGSVEAPLGSVTPGDPAGQPERVWVDETVRDGRRIAAHFDSHRLP